MADYMTLERRPLLMTGTWNASTGTEAVTDEDLASIVAAAESGVLDDPIVKIGHVDPRFQSYLEDGTPAYGQITNLSVEDGVLYGDYIHVPADLAESIDSAYPRSSVELARNVVLRDQEGNVVHEFGCVLTANALLGATAPAVKGLSTKMSAVAALSSGSPTYVEIRAAQFSLPGGNTARALNEKLSAAIQAQHTSDSTWAYLEDFTDDKVIFAVEGYGESTYYEQSYNIADTTSAPELVGTPVQVIKETKWVRETSGDTGTVQPQPAELAHSMSEAPPEQQDSDPNQGEPPMPTVDKKKAAELRKNYGLADNASYEDLLAKVLEDQDSKQERKNVAPGSDETPNPEVREQQVTEQQESPNFSEGEDEDDEDLAGAADEDDDDEDDEDEVEESEAAKQVRRDLATSRPKANAKGKARNKARIDSAKVSPSLLSDLQSRLSSAESRLAAREEAETKLRRDGFVTTWYKAGLIHDDEAKKVRASLDRDENLTVDLISERVPMFATSESGHSEPSIFAHSGDPSSDEFAADDAIFQSRDK